MNMLVSTAIAGTAVPALAAEATDPIFAAIDRHRRAYQEWMDSHGEDEIEDAVPSERRQSTYYGAVHGDPDWRVEGDDPRWIAHIETAIRCGDEHTDASIALVSFETISLAGAVALLEYVASLEAKDPESWPDLLDDDGKTRSWHYFLIAGLAETLCDLMPGRA